MRVGTKFITKLALVIAAPASPAYRQFFSKEEIEGASSEPKTETRRDA